MANINLVLTQRFLVAWLTAAALVAGGQSLAAAADAKSTAEEKAIRAAATAFVEAFNRGNAKDVAALWTVDGSLTEESAAPSKGREAIEKQYAAIFKAHPGAKLEVSIKSLEFPAPGVAVEDGVAQVESSDGRVTGASHYTAVHTLSGGKWLLSSVRENAIRPTVKVASLATLEGLIGQWVAHADGTTIQSDFHWLADKTFIQRDYTKSKDGKQIAKGTQIIGVDPLSGRIRSWSFDSTGGHGVGFWQATADGWQIESAGVRADGVPTRAVDRLIRPAGEANVVGWRSVGRIAGGQRLPDSEEIVFDRVSEQQKTGQVETN